MQSKLKKKQKSSSLEKLASENIIGVLVLLIFLCFFGATAQAIFDKANNVSSWTYLDWNIHPGKAWVIKFFYMLLLHASFIPVSLYVSMAMVRFFQSRFIANDLDIYSEARQKPALVRSMMLNEELGQITHIFSDKTGTLTCNNMNFRKASINGVVYGQGVCVRACVRFFCGVVYPFTLRP
jgi:P-type E1-E2 ATPase